MDKDSASIGMLKNPPPATKKLYYTSMVFDGGGLLLCTLCGWQLTSLMIIYVLVSKAYSWHGIRIKKYAFTGWLTVMLFQGAYTFLMVHAAAENQFDASWLTMKNGVAMLLSSLLIGGYYPLTQIYQHGEDSSRGDITISYKLGIRGTFIFTALLFCVACVVAWSYFTTYYNVSHFLVFIVMLSPVIAYFLFWFSITERNKSKADYRHAMIMTLISSTCMNICFGILIWLNAPEILQ